MTPIEPAWRFPFCPAPPDFHLDWAGLVARFDWLQAMAGCPQEPVYHVEGDVLIRVKAGDQCTASSASLRSKGRELVFP